MLQDKEVVNNYLAGLNPGLTGYTHIIAQTNNSELRQILIQRRNQDESVKELYIAMLFKRDIINLPLLLHGY